MKKFNLILRMVDNGTSEGGFAKMKENVVNPEQKDLNNNGGLGEGNLEDGVIPENEILSQNDPQAPVQNMDEEMPAKNEFDKMTEGVLGDVDLRKEIDNAEGKPPREDVDDIENLEPEAKRNKVDDQNIEEILSPEQRNEMIAEILGDPEFEKLIDQTMEKAENDQLYVNMDKLTKDLIEELKNYEGNEKEAFKKIIKEFFEGASDKVDRKELMELDPKKLIELDTQDILKQLGSSGSSSEAAKVINAYRETVEKIFEKEEIEIRDLTKSIREALGYREIDVSPSLNPETESIIQAIRNINQQIFGQKEEESKLDDIARRRVNMLLKLYHSMESERIREEKIQKHRDVMDEVFKLFSDEKKDISKMNLSELKDYIIKETRREFLHKKVLEERRTKGEISVETNQELEKEYTDDLNGQKKLEFLRNAPTDDLSELIAQEKNMISESSKRIAELEAQEQKNEAEGGERGSFLKDQGQKIISAMEEVEKDPKVAALKKIDIARSDGGEIPKELIEEAYQAFDIKNNPERKKMIDEFAKTGDISEQSEQSDSVSVGKATKVVVNAENPYKNGTPENDAFDIGKRGLLDAAQYNKHLIGISEKIKKGQKIEDIKLTGVKVESPQQSIQQTERVDGVIHGR